MRRSTKSRDGDIGGPGLGGRRTECERKDVRATEKESEKGRRKDGGRRREKERTERWCWPLHRERGGWSHLSRSRWSDATEKETPPRPGWRTRSELVRSRSFVPARGVCLKLCQTPRVLPPCITRGFAIAVGIRERARS